VTSQIVITSIYIQFFLPLCDVTNCDFVDLYSVFFTVVWRHKLWLHRSIFSFFTVVWSHKLWFRRSIFSFFYRCVTSQIVITSIYIQFFFYRCVTSQIVIASIYIQFLTLVRKKFGYFSGCWCHGYWNKFLIFVIGCWMADDEIKEYVMGAACSMCGGRREMRARFWWEILNDRDYIEDLGIDGWIMLKWVLKGYKEMSWTDFYGRA